MYVNIIIIIVGTPNMVLFGIFLWVAKLLLPLFLLKKSRRNARFDNRGREKPCVHSQYMAKKFPREG